MQHAAGFVQYVHSRTAVREICERMPFYQLLVNLHEAAGGTRTRGSAGHFTKWWLLVKCHSELALNHPKPFRSCERFCFKLSAVSKPLTELLGRKTHDPPWRSDRSPEKLHHFILCTLMVLLQLRVVNCVQGARQISCSGAGQLSRRLKVPTRLL